VNEGRPGKLPSKVKLLSWRLGWQDPSPTSTRAQLLSEPERWKGRYSNQRVDNRSNSK
jgi:hypothetical protein